MMSWNDLREALPDHDLAKAAEVRIVAYRGPAPTGGRQASEGRGSAQVLQQFERPEVAVRRCAAIDRSSCRSASRGGQSESVDQPHANQCSRQMHRHEPKTGGHDGKARSKSRVWDDKTCDQIKLPGLLLEQVMGARTLATVTEQDLHALNRCYRKVHGPTFRKLPAKRAMRSTTPVTGYPFCCGTPGCLGMRFAVSRLRTSVQNKPLISSLVRTKPKALGQPALCV